MERYEESQNEVDNYNLEMASVYMEGNKKGIAQGMQFPGLTQKEVNQLKNG